MAMTLKQIERRLSEMENDYGYSGTWPVSYQREFERLSAAAWRIRDRKARKSP